MRRLSGRLAGLGAIKIVAIGSSTTAGEGDIAPYPSGSNALRAGYAGRKYRCAQSRRGAAAGQADRGRQADLSEGIYRSRINGCAIILGGRRTTSRGIPRESQS